MPLRRLSLVAICAAFAVACGLAVAASRAAEEAKVVQMEPVLVEEIPISIKLRPRVDYLSSSGPRLVSLRVEEVRKDSAAERAGLKAGMEILAINGVWVRGRDFATLDPLWKGPFRDDVLVLKVMVAQRGFHPRPIDIRIPIKKPPPRTSEISIQIGP